MSTKTSLFCKAETNNKHELNIHIYKDMHESKDNVCVEFSCSTCHCCYNFLMAKHLGEQLVELLEGKDY